MGILKPVIHLDRHRMSATFVGWAGTVDTFGDLPAAGDHDGEFYMVLEATGSRFLFNYKSSGLYCSEGGVWVKKNNAQLLLNDDQFSVYNATDTSKVIGFDVSGISTGTTRTITWQDKDCTPACLTDLITFVHNQAVAATTWNIAHNLGDYPSVTIVDTGGNEVEGCVEYTDENNIILTFGAAFSGTAYLNT